MKLREVRAALRVFKFISKFSELIIGGIIGATLALITSYPQAYIDKTVSHLVDCDGAYMSIARDVTFHNNGRNRLNLRQLSELSDRLARYNSFCGKIGPGSMHASQYTLDRILASYRSDEKFIERLCFGLYIKFTETPSDGTEKSWAKLFASEREVFKLCSFDVGG